MENHPQTRLQPMEYSPIDYDVIRQSLHFSDSPSPQGTGFSPPGQSLEFQRLEHRLPDEYVQGLGNLALPTCSPPRQLPLLEYNANMAVMAYPAPLPEPEYRFEERTPPRNVPNYGDNHPTFQQVVDYVHQLLTPIEEKVDYLVRISHEDRSNINRLQEASVNNESLLIQRCDQIWSHIVESSRITAENFASSGQDLSEFRNRFNELIGNNLPEYFGKVQQSLCGLSDSHADRFRDFEQRYQDLSLRMENVGRYCQQLFDNIQNLTKNVTFLHTRARDSDSATDSQVADQIRDLCQNVSVLERKFATLQTLVQSCEGRFALREFGLSLNDRISTAESFHADITHTVRDMQNTFANLQTLLSENRQNIPVEKQRGVGDCPLTSENAQDLRPTLMLTNRVQFLDSFVANLEKRVSSLETQFVSLEKTRVYSQTIQRMDEDIRDIGDTISTYGQLEADVKAARAEISALQLAQKAYMAVTTQGGLSGNLQNTFASLQQNVIKTIPEKPTLQNPNSDSQGCGLVVEPVMEKISLSCEMARTNLVRNLMQPAVQIPGTHVDSNLIQVSALQESSSSPPVNLPGGKHPDMSDDTHSNDSFGQNSVVPQIPANTTGGALFLPRTDFQSSLEMSKKVRPQWDGHPLTWREFYQRWGYYWNLRSSGTQINPEMKKMLFIECLPKEEADRAMHLVVMEGISFEDLISRFEANCASLLPRFVLERKWRRCQPSDRKYPTIEKWYSTWKVLAANVGNLTDVQLTEQFDNVLLRFHPKIVRVIHEEELTGNKLSLEARWNLTKNRLIVEHNLGQIRSEFEQQGPQTGSSVVHALRPTNKFGSDRRCFKCNQPGHVQKDCRASLAPQRGRSPRSPRSGFSSRSGSNSSGRSSTKHFRKTKNMSRNSSSNSDGSRRKSPHDVKKETATNRYERSRSGSSGSNRSGNRSDSRRERSSRSPGRYGSRPRPYYSPHQRRGSSGKGSGPYRRPTPLRTDRTMLLERQKARQCLSCGGSDHQYRNCPKTRSRSSTPRRDTPSSQRQRVNFRVAAVQGQEDLPLGWEGDEGDEEAVDSYLAEMARNNPAVIYTADEADC